MYINKLENSLDDILSGFLQEFKSDLGKQAIVLMGLPASGKSTFINKDLQTYFPNASSYKVTNTDSQLKSLQYTTAKQHYNSIKTKTKKDRSEDNVKKVIAKFRVINHYVDNDGKDIKHPVTAEWWLSAENQGLKSFYNAFNKDYYASYFDVRDLASQVDKYLFKTKVKSAGGVIIIDTVAAKYGKIFKRLEKLKDKGFWTNIVYLEIDPDKCIIRDKYRKEKEGRGVGEKVIFGYAKHMDTAFKKYKLDGSSKNGIVDRVIHFKWSGPADPTKGSYILQKDYRYAVKRDLDALKKEKGVK